MDEDAREPDGPVGFIDIATQHIRNQDDNVDDIPTHGASHLDAAKKIRRRIFAERDSTRETECRSYQRDFVGITTARTQIHSSPDTPGKGIIIIKVVYSLLAVDYYLWVNPADNLIDIDNKFYGVRFETL